MKVFSSIGTRKPGRRSGRNSPRSPLPYPDFPFPGHVATDRLHWLRQEYMNASDVDKPRLAKQLLDRAEAAGDKAEAIRWRAILTPKPPPTSGARTSLDRSAERG